MVNRLSDLATFLNEDSVPTWLKRALVEQQQELATALDQGRPFDLTGPRGEKVTISPKHAAVVA